MSSHLPVMMYGALPYSDPDEHKRMLERLRDSIGAMPHQPTMLTVEHNLVTKTDLDEAVNRLERQMVALFEWLKERETKPKKKRKARR